MILTVTCCTYNRPHLLPRVIACFEAQDYQDRRMVIVDDGAQYQDGLKGDDGRWVIVSTDRRFESLGKKRRYSVHLAQSRFPDTDAILPIDDDDLFLPWHMSATAAALHKAAWSRPSVILSPRVLGDTRIFQGYETGNRLNPLENRMYHPAWGYMLSAYTCAGGYPEDQSGMEDKTLMLRMEAAGVTQADPIALGFKPSFIYCWERTQSISGMLSGDRDGSKAWANLNRTLEPATLEPWKPPFDLWNPIVSDTVHPRPF